MHGRAGFVREALLQEPAGRRVRCLVCERRCALVDGGIGWCRTRQNVSGRLVTLIYGAVSALSANPIEKKPLYHFWPGSVALTVGSWSCNFACPWCQNWDISKSPPPTDGRYLSPERCVMEALRRGCRGTSLSFNEPTLSLEWSLDVFRLARQVGLYNTFVTNGYMTPEALALLVKAGLDAANVDVKGDASAVKHYCKADVEAVWCICRAMKAAGVHLEITTLVIPGVNDADETLHGIASRITAELGSDTPWHVSGYYPAYRFTAPPTPVTTLERAWAIGQEAGLDFVYIGNVAGHPRENTWCPGCGTLLIGRWGLMVTVNRLRDGQCPDCGRTIPMIGL